MTLRLHKTGIEFPDGSWQMTSAENSALDYEEGTFTPIIEGHTNAGIGTYSMQSGKYIKIGKLVHIQWCAKTTAHTGSGVVKLCGLPFASDTSSSNYAVFSIYHAEATFAANSYPMPFMNNGNNWIWINQVIVGGGSPSSASDLVAQYMVTGTYYCV